MVAVIVDTNAKLVAENNCSTSIECYEWMEQYCGWMGLEKVTPTGYFKHHAHKQVVFVVRAN
jgi:hypothetical protein